MEENKIKPVVKWAGGKGQMLKYITPRLPEKYNKYIEPFVGGGALFFSEMPQNAIISDSNEELINLYKIIADDVDGLIDTLKDYHYDKEQYYSVRSKNPSELSPTVRAARMLYLNKTGFNGLYRVNQRGEFNVPFGKYTNPKIIDEDNLRKASDLLKKTLIMSGDYLDVLHEYAKPGDFIFLDPPYMPVSKYSDFKRYTKVQFGEQDQIKLAEEVDRLYSMGCNVMLTNSNHPFITELYKKYDIQVFDTKRLINSKSDRRNGQDIIVTAYPKLSGFVKPSEIPTQNEKYPSSRYMGSKTKLLPYIDTVVENLDYNSVLDLFSGSGTVSYFFKTLGKQVFSNDYMKFASNFSKATVENNDTRLTDADLNLLLDENIEINDLFVSDNFKGLYFSDDDNRFLDLIRTNENKILNPVKKSIIDAAISRACMKRRPRGIFTYTGNKYDDGRKDLTLSLKEHFIKAVNQFNDAVFDNGCVNVTFNENFLDVECDADLVYLDPPYYSPLSDNEYVRRYHFVEGLAKNWENVQMQWNTKTKKFKNYPTPFSSKEGTYAAFEQLFEKYSRKIVIVSYSSNSLPTKAEMTDMMRKYFSDVKTYEIDYKYSFGNQHKNKSNNKVKEYLFVGL
ncbi:Dam family site-specific DNA-(adenine-N6)-methyltransferase [Companilactobacillus sp.]|uniref:Dam family site-specific DNA-(adenine-N6)-methyltransferase n=1 Tax=Companilactobacillus sp. TaxID=2767905 RepID=UPI0026276053|nr:Dam family site-specific DNA-(adenine-N6)-methyltransferase [Companilactobacillus sp.]